MLLAVPQAFHKNVLIRKTCKNIGSANGGKADKIDSFGILELVTGAHALR